MLPAQSGSWLIDFVGFLQLVMADVRQLERRLRLPYRKNFSPDTHAVVLNSVCANVSEPLRA